MTPNADLDRAAEDFARLRAELHPLFAMTMGDESAPTVALHDVSETGEAAARGRMAALLDRVEAVPVATLDATERTTHHMLRTTLAEEIQQIDLRAVEMALDAFFSGPQAVLLMALPKTPIATHDAAADYLARLARIPGLIGDTLDRLRHGATSGRTVTRVGAEGAIAQTRALLATDIAEHPFLIPLRQAAAAGVAVDAQVAAAEALLHGAVHDALTGFAAAVEADLLPPARSDENVGLCHLPDGPALYAAALARHTTTDMSPEAIHRVGLDVIAGLAEEYAAIGSRVFGTSDLEKIFARLKTDEALRFADPAEAVAHAQACVDRATAASAGWFGRLPSTPCVVTPMPEAAARGMTVAYYQPPRGGDDAHGTYWINTHDPVISRYEAECVAFHEAVPGHHTQIALQAELDLPRFRQVGTILSGFQEGWGLYTERLCEEMGLYSDDLSRLGMLAMDSLRGSRLVIDTGLHHLGWSRQQALDYMLANAPVNEAFARAEVDRYCVFPGLECSYMIGRHEIERLRHHAEQTLGGSFDIRDFHDVVLGQGAVPLTTLAMQVQDWLDGTAAAA